MAKLRIDDFLSKKARPDRVALFEKMSAGKSKEEVRKLEMEMLEPEPLPMYTGEEIRYIANSELSVRFVFKNEEEMELFGKYVPIATYLERSVTDIRIILDLFRSMESGKITYDKKTGKFCLTDFPHLADTKKHPAPEINQEKKEDNNEENESPLRKLLRRRQAHQGNN